MKRLLRSVLAKYGYVLWKRDNFRFGISPFVDMARLNAAWGRPLEIVFDVGANVGEFSREVREEMPAVKIYSFEPHPHSFARLSASKADSSMHRHCLALSDRIGEVMFYEYASEGDGSHINSLVPDARFPVRFGYEATRMKVQSSTLDQFCAGQGIDRIDFLKIDVEGTELAVLKGAARMLSQGQILAAYLEFNDLDSMVGASGGALLPIAGYLGKFGLRYACTYTDSLLSNNELHVVANALFVLPPGASRLNPKPH